MISGRARGYSYVAAKWMDVNDFLNDHFNAM